MLWGQAFQSASPVSVRPVSRVFKKRLQQRRSHERLSNDTNRQMATLWEVVVRTFPNAPDLDFPFSGSAPTGAIVMSTNHARVIHTAMKQSLGSLEGWINETKQTNSTKSFTSAVCAQLCLASFLAGAGKQVLMPYLSTVISEAITNHAKQGAVDQPDVELENEDDGEDDPETEDISMSPDWKVNFFSWLSLITLHSSLAISLTQLSMNPKHSWLLDGHYVFADRKLSDGSTMEPWRNTIRQNFRWKYRLGWRS